MVSVAKQCKVPLLPGLAWTACIALFAEMLRDELPRVSPVCAWRRLCLDLLHPRPGIAEAGKIQSRTGEVKLPSSLDLTGIFCPLLFFVVDFAFTKILSRAS